jgi:tetratricopeptide (TPR) repeat protein
VAPSSSSAWCTLASALVSFIVMKATSHNLLASAIRIYDHVRTMDSRNFLYATCCLCECFLIAGYMLNGQEKHAYLNQAELLCTTELNNQSLSPAWKAHFYLLLARCYICSGKEEGAIIACLKTAVRLDPKNFRTFQELAMCYTFHRKYKAAEQSVLAGLSCAQSKPEEEIALVYLGYLHILQLQTNKAEDMLQRVLRLNDLSGVAYFLLGYVFYRKGNYTESEKILRHSQKLQPIPSTLLLCCLHKKTNLKCVEQDFYELKTALKKNTTNYEKWENVVKYVEDLIRCK